MPTRRRFLLALLATLPLAAAGCVDTTEPQYTTECTQAAFNYKTTPGFVTTASGLQYRDVVIGPGTSVGAGSRVIVNYAACVASGLSFAGAIGPSHLIFSVGQGQVIKGLDEGVVGMKLGGRRTLIVPRELGYGTTGSPGGFLVPDETLIITVDAVGLQ
jgi:FKBP-type peptidyl-prolyl cis-trans isomerase